MNSDLQALQPYPFEKLAQLKQGVVPPDHLQHIALSIGEPKHAPPEFVLRTLTGHLAAFAQYPATKGVSSLRETVAEWLSKRFHIPPHVLDPERHILPVAGTREALFSFVQACVTASPAATVIMPNPFYQIYEGAAILAGAKPYFINCTEENAFIPPFEQVPEHVWEDCEILFVCSPGNPTGAVMSIEQMQKLIQLADRHDFIIASDECYSELYFDEHQPPPGLLQACIDMGRDNFSRCVVFHSLSKRSNLPGLRSGFVAGDADILGQYLLYRTYEGCALPLPTQYASIAAWKDEEHVRENREKYRDKFIAVLEILNDVLPLSIPDAGFYLWLPTPIKGTDFAKQLYAEQNVTVLPGQFLARPTAAGNPGSHRVRIALVAELDECVEAAQRIKNTLAALPAYEANY